MANAATAGGVPGSSTGGATGTSTGGAMGSSTGGVPGSSTGGVPGSSTGGVPGSSTGGVAGRASTGGATGSSTGGVPGSNTGGVANAAATGGAAPSTGGGSSTGGATLICVPIVTGADCVGRCGPLADGCGGLITCPDCTPPQCCGCGSPGTPSVCGSGATGSPSVQNTCLAGQKGCLCDTMGVCAPGLTCTPQTPGNPSLCCSGTDCAGTGTDIGGNCGTITAPPTCEPGVTIPAATGGNDTCGYVATSFNESELMCGIVASGGGSNPAQIQAFYMDEWAMPLGCATAAYPVSPLPSNPGAVYYPQTGDPACVDPSGRPLRPSLFITDITADPACRAGDQQQGGAAYDPVAVFGTWLSASANGTPGTSPTPQNRWNLGAAADPVPTAVSDYCVCTDTVCNTTGKTGRGYGTEMRFEAGLISGHSYRLQVIFHDGDQTQGGDAGEACAIFCAGTGICVPNPCSPEACGPQPDGCGGIVECPPCCTPMTCEQSCALMGTTCFTVQDAIYTMSCPQPNGCGAVLPCWCKAFL